MLVYQRVTHANTGSIFSFRGPFFVVFNLSDRKFLWHYGTGGTTMDCIRGLNVADVLFGEALATRATLFVC